MVEHVDPDALALVALGETADEPVRAHLADCAVCAREVSELAAVVALARTVTPADTPVPAPDGVWAGVRSELGLSPALEPDGGQVASRAQEATDGPARRRSTTPWIAAAAAAGVVLGGAGGAWWASQDPSDAEPAVVAEAALEPLPGWEASGQAVVEQQADGTRVLVLSVESDTGTGGFREVWLIDRDVTRLVSLGVLEGTEGRFTVPSGLDLDDFAVVDVSEEPIDGDPAHSGDSIVRGVLDA